MSDNIRMKTQQRALELRALFSKNPTYREFETRFQYLFERRLAEIAAGVVAESHCIALIGASGSGKTTAAEHLFATQSGSTAIGHNSGHMDVVSLQVPSPATLKFVGQTTLNALGYPMAREKTAQTIWDTVKRHLKGRETKILHLDEAQDLMRHQTPKELNAVVSTLKSLMQHKAWPVGLVLTGTTELKTLINHDRQLMRRVYPIQIPSLNLLLDGSQVRRMMIFYADRAQLTLSPEVLTSDFPARLMHAAGRQFGLTIQLLTEALEEAMTDEANEVQIKHFTVAFRKRHACIDGLNPFIADDFERIDVLQMFEEDGDE